MTDIVTDTTIAGLYFCIGEDAKGSEWLERSYSRKDLGLTHSARTGSTPGYPALLNASP